MESSESSTTPQGTPEQANDHTQRRLSSSTSSFRSPPREDSGAPTLPVNRAAPFLSLLPSGHGLLGRRGSEEEGEGE
jgi:hypothetical protein